jgi:hypothetical protein
MATMLRTVTCRPSDLDKQTDDVQNGPNGVVCPDFNHGRTSVRGGINK